MKKFGERTVRIAASDGFYDGTFAFQPMTDRLSQLGWDVEHDWAANGAAGSPLISFNGLGMTKSSRKTSMQVLIILEPRATLPAIDQISSRADAVWSASHVWASRYGGEYFLWPQVIEEARVVPTFGRFAATLVNADKRSADSTSMYGLRRAVISHAQKERVAVATVGHGWARPLLQKFKFGGAAVARQVVAGKVPSLNEAFGATNKPQFYVGYVRQKREAFSLARSTIIIENSMDYVSEKVVDAIRFGVVPIYVGPRLSDFGIPDDVAFQVPPSPSSVLGQIQSLTEESIFRIRAQGATWLSSKSAEDHSRLQVMGRLGEEISWWLDSNYTQV